MVLLIELSEYVMKMYKNSANLMFKALYESFEFFKNFDMVDEQFDIFSSWLDNLIKTLEL